VIAVPHLKKEMENLFSRFFESTSCFQGHAASLPSFLKLVWNQGQELAELIETHIISFAPKGEKIEKMIHDDVPVIFLFATKNRLAISKKFSVETILVNPGYNFHLI
jgi:hypothetical protein